MIKNAKIVSVDTSARKYAEENAKPGDAKLTMRISSLQEFGRCPEKWVNGFKSPDSESREYGSLLDCRLLTPNQLNDRYAIQPSEYESTGMKCPQCGTITDSAKCRDCKTDRVPVVIKKEWSANSKTCQDWTDKQKAAGREITYRDQLADADAAIKRLMTNQTISAFIHESDKQVWIQAEWHDKATGLVIPIKCMLDLFPRPESEFSKCVADFKTTRNAGLKAFARNIEDFGYYIQGAFYLDMAQAACPERDLNTFCWIVQENFHPWQPGKRAMGQDLLDAGRNDCRALLKFYCHCLKNGTWPGYEAADPLAIQGWSYVHPSPWLQPKTFETANTETVEQEPPPSEDVPLN